MPVAEVRPPAVAGRFYPSDSGELTRELEACLKGEKGEPEQFERPIGCVVPHAGYMYSGPVAGAVYRRLPERASYVILGPNHFGRGAPLALSARGAWLTPLGKVKIDPILSKAVADACPLLVEDDRAHSSEHSLEVQLPFLQHTSKHFTIVPIAIGTVGYAALESLGRGVAKAVEGAAHPVLIIASSDMNHYEPDDVTRVKDHKAIEAILALDPEGLLDAVRRHDVSMCGYGAAIALLAAARELGASNAELVKYATSADAGGDRDAVVGYAGIVIS